MTCTGEHDFAPDGVCRRCQHWDPQHDTTPVHLATGLYVHGKPRLWCRAEVIIVGRQVRNATDTEERCTCEPCKAALAAAKARHAAKDDP